MLRKAWSKIYEGNQQDTGQLVQRYMDKYAEYVHRHAEVEVGDITGAVVHDTFTCTKASAAGLDS